MGDPDNSLRVMNADGSGSRALLKDHAAMWDAFTGGACVKSPDGKRLAFGLGYIPDTIYVVSADGSGPSRVIKKARVQSGHRTALASPTKE